MDREKFLYAVNAEKKKDGIGTLSEKTLHSVVKNYYEPHPENQEIKVGGYVADIVGENGIIEIQTRTFDKMRKKLTTFLEVCDVTVVYPVSGIKWILWIDKQTGEVTKKRKSTRKGIPQDIFFELYKIKPFLDNDRLHFKIPLLETEEYRYLDGWSKDRKKGSSKGDRIPVDILDEININKKEDFNKLMPASLPEIFTVKDFSEALKINDRYGWTALDVLTKVGVVKKAGKKGNANLYTTKDAN